MIDEATAKAVVRKRFAHGELSQVLSDGSIIVRVGKSYTKLRSNEVQNTIIELKHQEQPIRLSEETLAQIHEEKYGKRPEPEQTPQPTTPQPTAQDVHRKAVAEKYGL